MRRGVGARSGGRIGSRLRCGGIERPLQLSHVPGLQADHVHELSEAVAVELTDVGHAVVAVLFEVVGEGLELNSLEEGRHVAAHGSGPTDTSLDTAPSKVSGGKEIHHIQLRMYRMYHDVLRCIRGMMYRALYRNVM